MADLRTEVTELATALGMVDHDTVSDALRTGSSALVDVESDRLARLEHAAFDERYSSVVATAFANGRAFLAARDGLRGRVPRLIEWKGPHRPPGYDLLPADLRIDHVYLVSCKYQSRLLMNASPSHLFERRLQVRSAQASHQPSDWYSVVAPDAYRDLYHAVRRSVGLELPDSVTALTGDDRRTISSRCSRRWPPDVQDVYRRFCRAVSTATAARWSDALPSLREREELLWRLLRLSDCPYFVLGSAGSRPLRLRIATPWDWRQRFALRSFMVSVTPAGQPQVTWEASFFDRRAGREGSVRGHVEIRWSHGRFCGMPEAKVYLDTPHDVVPGYFPLDGDEVCGAPGPHRTAAPSHRPSTVPSGTMTLPLWDWAADEWANDAACEER